MPIEFPCPGCSSLLRTPDSSAGKKAKCPQCGAIADVPSQTDSAASSAGTPDISQDRPTDFGSGPSSGDSPFSQPFSLGAESANPFADAASSPFAPRKSADSYNPYAAPSIGAELPTAAAQPQGALLATRIEFGQTWKATWKVFSENLGTLLLLTLIVVGMVVIAYAAIAGVVAAFIFGAMNQNADPTILILAVPVGLALLALGLFAYSWIEAGLALVTVGLCRGAAVRATDIFSGGRFTIRVVLLNLLRGVINFTISFVCGMMGQALAVGVNEPAVAAVGSLLANVINYVVTLMLLLTTFFIVDRNLDVLPCLSMSVQFMRGNKLTVFGLHFVSGVCVLAVVLFTCGTGALFVLPFYLSLHAVIYMLATGQRLAHEGP